MYCRRCGKELEDEARFCRNCGWDRLENADGNGVSPQPFSSVEVQPVKTKNKTALIVGIILLALLAGGIGVLVGTGILGKENKTSAQREEEEERSSIDREEKEERGDKEEADDNQDPQMAETGDAGKETTEPDKAQQGTEDSENDSEKRQSATYVAVQEVSGMIISDSMTLEAEGDRVVKIIEVLEVDMTDFDEADSDSMAVLYDELVEQYQSVEGVQAFGSYSNRIYRIDIVVDTTGDAVAQLADMGLMSIEGSTSGISLKASGAAMEAGGYTRVE